MEFILAREDGLEVLWYGAGEMTVAAPVEEYGDTNRVPKKCLDELG